MPKPSLSFRRITVLALAGTVFAGAAFIAVAAASQPASPSTPAPHSPNPTGASPCQSVPSQTPSCASAQAEAKAQAQAARPAILPPGGSYITSSRAEFIARNIGAPAIRAAAPAGARFVQYAAAAGVLHEQMNPMLLSSTPVWIVTVVGPVPRSSVPQPAFLASGGSATWPGYTTILDAINGGVIDTCYGCLDISTSTS